MSNSAKFLIATCVGGVPEIPQFTYHNFDVIFSNNRREALQLYNKKYNCNYFYGTILAISIEGELYLTEEAIDVVDIKKHLEILKINKK